MTSSPRAGALAWAALAAALALAALAGLALPAGAIDWQPGRAAAEPWRAWTAVAVHYSPLHLSANLAGLALIGTLGWAGELPPRAALGWAAAWPLTQAGLLARPDLLHYGGLSGVLHAGVVVAATVLLLASRGRRRLVAAAMLLVVATKVLLEQPWGPALRQPDGWDIAVAPLAHATGALAGLACGMLAGLLPERSP